MLQLSVCFVLWATFKAMGRTSMCFSPERQPNNEPKAEDKTKVEQ